MTSKVPVKRLKTEGGGESGRFQKNLKLKIEVIHNFHTKSTLKYFECHIQSITMVFYVPCNMEGHNWETDFGNSLT